MSKIRFVLCLSVLFVLSGNVAGAVDLTGTWDWYGVEMSITQTGQQVNAVINISQPEIGNNAGDQMFCGTLNGQTLTGKIKVHGTPEYKTLCPATYFNFTDVTITVSADENTLQGQLKNVFMNNDCTITPSENWVSMGTLTKKNNTPVYSGSSGASACSGSSSGTISTYTIIFQAGNGGTISGSSSQTVKQGSSASAVTAVPNNGYQFVNWTGTNGFNSTANPLTVSNVSANMTISANFQQIPQNRSITPSTPCIQVGDDLTLPIACAEYKSVKYTFDLNYDSDLYWKMNLNTFGNSLADDYCLSVGDDLKFKIFCAEYKENSYAFDLNYSQRLDDPFGFYWKMDLDTFRKIDDIAIIYIDKTSVQPGTIITITGKGFKSFDNPDVFIGNEKAYIIDFNKEKSIVKAMIPMIDAKAYDLYVSLKDTVKTNSFPIVVEKLSLPDTITPDQVISSKVIGGFKNFISYFNSSVIDTGNLSEEQKASLRADVEIFNGICDNLSVYWQNEIPKEIKPQIAAILYNSGIGDILNNPASSTRLRSKTVALRNNRSNSSTCGENPPSNKTATCDCGSTEEHEKINGMILARQRLGLAGKIADIAKDIFYYLALAATTAAQAEVAVPAATASAFFGVLGVVAEIPQRYYDTEPINLIQMNLVVGEDMLHYNDEANLCWEGTYESLSDKENEVLSMTVEYIFKKNVKSICEAKASKSPLCVTISNLSKDIYGELFEKGLSNFATKEQKTVTINPGFLDSMQLDYPRDIILHGKGCKGGYGYSYSVVTKLESYTSTLKVIGPIPNSGKDFKNEKPMTVNIKASALNISEPKATIEAEISLTVYNREPKAYDKSFSGVKLNVQKPLQIIQLTDGVLKDQECDQITQIVFPTLPKYGTIADDMFALKAEGLIKYTYTMQAKKGEKDVFTYRVFDGVDWSEPATITINLDPIEPCNKTTVAGDDDPNTTSYNMGKTSGDFSFSYDTRSQKDQIIISYEGREIFNTGCVGAKGTKSVHFSGNTDFVTVYVSPNCAGGKGTVWDYTIGCPE